MTDPLLKEDTSRYVMFPIQDDDIWKMYKKQVDCFWRVEEIDLSKDLGDWAKLTADEFFKLPNPKRPDRRKPCTRLYQQSLAGI